VKNIDDSVPDLLEGDIEGSGIHIIDKSKRKDYVSEI